MMKLEGLGYSLCPSRTGPSPTPPVQPCSLAHSAKLCSSLGTMCSLNTSFPSLLLHLFSPGPGPSIWNFIVLASLSYLVPLSFKVVKHHLLGSFLTLSGWPGHLSPRFPRHSVHPHHRAPQTTCQSAVAPGRCDGVPSA